MLKLFTVSILLAMLATSAGAQLVKSLVGTYQMETLNGDVLELRSNGTAALGGEETTWAANATNLRVGPDTMPYTLQGGRLILSMGSVLIPWKRIAAPSRGTTQPELFGRTMGPYSRPTPVQPLERPNSEDYQARQTLMRNAWCSFTYNQVSGTSTTRRLVFRPDGVMTINGGAETYSSGHAGIYAGQSNSANAMRWKLENLRLYIDQGGGNGYEDVGLTAPNNSNGSIILRATGREYSMCN